MKLFDLDSKFMHYANKVADLMILNLLTLVCCIPIITAGASITAMHRVLLAIYRDEEGYIMKTFFKSFKENFKQSTILWLIYLLLFGVLFADFMLITKGGVVVHKFVKYALMFVAVIALISYTWVFILQSRYENTIKNTIKNSFIIAIGQIFYSIMMILMTILPILLLMWWDNAVPFVLVFGFTVPGLLQAMLYSRVFDKMEGVDRKALKEQQQEDDGWTVELEEEETDAQEPLQEEVQEKTETEAVQE